MRCSAPSLCVLVDSPWHEFPKVSDEQVQVILNACYSSDFKVTSKNTAQPLNEILQTMPDPGRVRGSSHHGSGRDSRDDWKKTLVKKHPWLESALKQDKKRKKADESTGTSSSPQTMTEELDAPEAEPPQ